MASTTVRLPKEAWEVLRELARQADEPMQRILANAIESYRRQKFLERANAEYAALRADREGWEEEARERQEWESTLADGLEND